MPYTLIHIIPYPNVLVLELQISKSSMKHCLLKYMYGLVVITCLICVYPHMLPTINISRQTMFYFYIYAGHDFNILITLFEFAYTIPFTRSGCDSMAAGSGLGDSRDRWRSNGVPSVPHDDWRRWYAEEVAPSRGHLCHCWFLEVSSNC